MKFIYILFISCFIILSLNAGIAQQTSRPSGGATAVCVWDAAGLRAEPGKDTRSIDIVYFGEEVSLLGNEAYVPAEKRSYLQVKTKGGLSGWMHEYLLVKDGKMIVVTDEAAIYKSPATLTTVTGQMFEPGDLAAMNGSEDDWISLVGRKKNKVGWIQGGYKVSMNQSDIEIATLLHDAKEETNPVKKKNKMDYLQSRSDVKNSRLSYLITGGQAPKPVDVTARKQPVNSNTKTYTFSDPIPKPPHTAVPPATSGNETKRLNQPITSVIPPVKPSTPSVVPDPNYELVTEKVYDLGTNKEYWRTTEKGGVYEVRDAIAYPPVYFAYHKTLPLGTKVLLQFPDNDGYVELKVINRLRPDNPNMIGLSSECIRAVFGGTSAKIAEIQYFTKVYKSNE